MFVIVRPSKWLRKSQTISCTLYWLPFAVVAIVLLCSVFSRYLDSTDALWKSGKKKLNPVRETLAAYLNTEQTYNSHIDTNVVISKQMHYITLWFWHYNICNNSRIQQTCCHIKTNAFDLTWKHLCREYQNYNCDFINISEMFQICLLR